MRALNAAFLAMTVFAGLAGCDVIYHSATVRESTEAGAKVRVVPLTAETVLVANRSSFTPQTLPAVFSQTAGHGSPRSVASPPAPSLDQPFAPGQLELRVPPEARPGPLQGGRGRRAAAGDAAGWNHGRGTQRPAGGAEPAAGLYRAG